MLYFASRGHGLSHPPQKNYNLIKSYERSVTKHTAAVRGFNRSLFFCTRKQRRTSFTTYETHKPYTFPILTEIEVRLARIQSVLSSDFLRTHRPAALGLETPAMLDKFRAGLTTALLAADELADYGAWVPQELIDRDMGDTFDAWHVAEDAAANDGEWQYVGNLNLSPAHKKFSIHYDTSYFRTVELRQRQCQRIRHFPTRTLSWMITLAAGCGRGCVEERHGNSLEVEPNGLIFYEEDDDFLVEMAAKEAVLRYGSKYLWMCHGAGRGDKYFHWAPGWFAECKQDVDLYDFTGGVVYDLGVAPGEKAQDIVLPPGVHMSIMGELTDRIIAHRHRLADMNKTVFDETSWSARDTMNAVHKLVATEIGFSQWKGYNNLGNDPLPVQLASSGFFV